MTTPPAESGPRPLGLDSPARVPALRTAVAPLEEAVGGRVEVAVDRLDRLGQWVVLFGTMRNPDGGRPDFAGTAFARQAADGQLSDLYVALVKAPDGQTPGWELRECAIGPTDVAWADWATKHSVPPELFDSRAG